MKITIINNERNEKRYTRVELEEFVAQLKDGFYRERDLRDSHKEVCFAAEWLKTNGELKAKALNSLVLLSLENLRDLATVRENKEHSTLVARPVMTRSPTTIPMHSPSPCRMNRRTSPNTASHRKTSATSTIPRRFPA